MGVGEIVSAAKTASEKFGFKALVLQSGEDSWYTDEKLAQIVRGVREACGAIIFMSVGERSMGCYRRMYDEGARGVLLRFETSNPKIYAKMGKGKLAKRISLLRSLRKMGYLIITGSLIGLPAQTDGDLLNDILLARELGAEMFSFGPFIPHPETALAHAKPPPLGKVLAVLAAARFAQPDAKILVTTALETLDSKGRELGLLSGANSVMINATPLEYRKLYAIYPAKAWIGTPTELQIAKTIALLKSLGRAPTDLGISKGFANDY
jgi:biotin synthase